MKEGLELWYEGVAGLRENLHKHRLGEGLEGHDDGEATYELRDHAEVNHVTCLHLVTKQITDYICQFI